MADTKRYLIVKNGAGRYVGPILCDLLALPLRSAVKVSGALMFPVDPNLRSKGTVHR